MKRTKAGFTIVEVLIAVIMLSIGILALAGTSGAITRMLASGKFKTRAATVIQTRLDSLRVVANRTTPKCTSLSNGTATVTPFSLVWVISGAGASRSIELRTSYRVGPRMQGDTVRALILCR